MSPGTIIGIVIIVLIFLVLWTLSFWFLGYKKGYNEGYEYALTFTKKYVDDLMKVGEDIDIPNASSSESTNKNA